MNAVQRDLLESALLAPKPPSPVDPDLAERIRAVRVRIDKGELWLAEERVAGRDRGERYDWHMRLWLDLLTELEDLAKRCPHTDRTPAVIVEGDDGGQYEEDSCTLCGMGWRRRPIDDRESRPAYTRQTPTPKPTEACFVCGSTEYTWHDLSGLYGLWECAGCGPKAGKEARNA